MSETPILIFCHNYINYNWYEIVQEQLTKLVKSGLYEKATEIYYGAYAHDKWELFKFVELVKLYDITEKIKIIAHPINDGERQTMILMQEICKNYPEAYVLYYHTKGITSKLNHLDLPDLEYKNIESWRHAMEYFNIECWEKSIEELTPDPTTTVGIFYVGDQGWPHKYFYSGNFWWAKASYLNTLSSMKERDNRMGCELWIGTGLNWWKNLYQAKGGNIYREYYDPKEYRKDLES
jgi:hypothetical protein